MTGIRIVRLGKGRALKPVKSRLPVITEQEAEDAAAAARVPKRIVADVIPPGFVSVDGLAVALDTRGGALLRKIHRMLAEGTLTRATFRHPSIDGRVRHCAFYKILKARSSISRTPGSQPEKKGATPLRAASLRS